MTAECLPLLLARVQIRLAGLKGVLALNPLLPGKQLGCRPSQQKFGSSHLELEVVSLGTRIPYHLNRCVLVIHISTAAVPSEQAHAVHIFTHFSCDIGSARLPRPARPGWLDWTKLTAWQTAACSCQPTPCLALCVCRHLIMLLTNAGVPASVFVAKQRAVMAQLDALLDPRTPPPVRPPCISVSASLSPSDCLS